mgnify:CR=1 FL=1
MELKKNNKDVSVIHKEVINFYNNDSNYLHKIKNRSSDTYRAIFCILDTFDSKDLSILDVGCGTGNLLSLLKSKGYKNIEGVDCSKTFVKEAKKDKKIEIYENDVINFSPNKKYDVIIMTDVLEHSVHPGRIIKKCSILLKKEGIIVIGGPNLLQIIYGIVHINIRKIPLFIKKMSQYLLNSRIMPYYIEPKLDKETYKNTDSDACYLINPFDIMYFLKNEGFKKLFCSTFYNPTERYTKLKRREIILADKMPLIKYTGFSLLIVASKNKSIKKEIIKRLSANMKKAY